MRIPSISNPPPTCSAEEEAIVAAIAARRHPRPIQPLDSALLYSPHVVAGWDSFVGAVRTKSSLADDLRELAIAVVKLLLKSEQPEGFTEKQWAICVIADEMTRNVQVKDETFDWLKALSSHQEVVEVVATDGMPKQHSSRMNLTALF
ncbi:hypothetical protein F53441_799 [Fusarium austroafricanum]|uniref:Uncharacterized protein n=1 Tax=Fusarium austroafricanum TaxID=2364996 RepID=A0A8H4KW56_9HYPO|nr:hypothetical protein F53441_799 [Fusarium austroafricanum]